MKKFLSLLIAVSMVFAFAGCSDSNESNNQTELQTEETTQQEESKQSEEQNELSQSFDKDKIIIGLDENFPPMGFRNENNEIVGFDIDLAKEAAKRMGITVEFQPINWDSKELELDSGKVDLLWNGLTITEGRLENMLFTKPYLNNKQVILVKNDSAITKKDDLKGKPVGVQAESSAIAAVENDPIGQQLQLNEYSDNILAFTDLDLGRVDAVVADEIVVKYYLENNDTNFKLLDEDFGDEQYGIAAKKGNEALVNKLQAALDEMIADGSAAKISDNWFGSDIIVKE